MRIAILTTGRQDWSLLCAVAKAMRAAPDFDALLWAGGMHLQGGALPAELDGITVQAHVMALPPTDDGAGVCWAAGATTQQVGRLLMDQRPDALLLAGDRTETLGAALAATCARVAIVHLHGGEETEGAIDNACRHAISKLAQVHFVAHASFAARLRRMGEDPSRVVVSGAPGLDLATAVVPLDRVALAGLLSITDQQAPWLLCTHHPTTLGELAPRAEFAEVLEGLDQAAAALGAWIVFTRPNVDEGGNALNRMLDAFVETHPKTRVAVSLGGSAYLSMLRHAACMVGNSSSGIIEAPLFQLPVVNVGARQQGRLRGSNVLDVAPERGAVAAGIMRACSKEYGESLRGTTSPYGDGKACERILAALRSQGPKLGLTKRFVWNQE